MTTLDEWLASGERINIRPENDEPISIFCKTTGKGHWLTFLHGFPTCSWDWSKVTEKLKHQRQLLLFDFLGFGDSDKPGRHKYSIFEQADITETLWQRLSIDETTLVAHDYGDTVALELLSRQEDGQLTTKIARVVMLNGGVYVAYQRPLLIQRMLKKPVIGSLLARLISEKIFKRRFAKIFSTAHPIAVDDLEQFWQAVRRGNGVNRSHRIIQYLSERRKFKGRWEDTLENSKTPIRFVWGQEDPVSGKNISQHLRERNASVDLLELDDVGHYPQWEVPEVVVEEILNLTSA